MRDISHQRVNAVLSEVFVKIRELRLKGNIHKDDEEEIILSAIIKDMGITKGEPIFDIMKAEFYRIISYKEG